MHDITFAKKIISAIEDRSKTLEKKTRICSVNANLSPLSHVKPDGLKETFAALVKATPMEGIKLNIKPLKIDVTCKACKEHFSIDKPTFLCPKCHSSDLIVDHSMEFKVDSVEVELIS